MSGYGYPSSYSGGGYLSGGGAPIVPISRLSGAGASAGAGTDTATTSAINTVGATLLIATVTRYQDTIPVLSDSRGNTWTALPISSFNNVREIMYYCINPLTSATHTFSAISAGSSYCSVAVDAFNNTGAFVSSVNNGHASNLAIPMGPITPSGANSLVVTGIGYFDQPGAQAATISAGFTHGGTALDGTSSCSRNAYQIQTTATMVNPTWTLPSNPHGSGGTIAVFAHA